MIVSKNERTGVSVLCHVVLHFQRAIGDGFFAEETATVGSDEDIVFNAHAAEVAIFVHLVEVDELVVFAALSPVVDEVWDEIDARFVGDNMSWFEFACKS